MVNDLFKGVRALQCTVVSALPGDASNLVGKYYGGRSAKGN